MAGYKRGFEGLSLYSDSQARQSGRDTRRSFNASEKGEIWDRQKGKCTMRKERLLRSATHFDHKIPWELGGKTIISNGQALCPTCHAIKTNRDRLKIQAHNRRAKKSGQTDDWANLSKNIMSR